VGAALGSEGGRRGADEQAASSARIRAPAIRPHPMLVILLEALAALSIFVFIIWWTMFSGRKRGERRED
jgi:hypothetical protein